jgi:hypothetical protein
MTAPMAQDYSLPYLNLINLVPQRLRNPMIRSLTDNLFDRFLTQDEAVPLYGYVGRKPVSPDDRTPKVPQLNVERDINALIPVLSFKVGDEMHSFTAQDLIRKAQVLGISEDQSQWLYSQGNNYAPPIDFDKFTNFFNYYWVANAMPSVPDLAWNPTKDPEYYVVTVPKPTDLDKLNVHVSTTANVVLTGTGYYPQTWTVMFTSPTTFTVTTTDPLALPGEVTQGPFTLPTLTTVAAPGPYPTDVFPVQFIASGAPGPLLTFEVVRDVILDNSGGPYTYEAFATGDSLLITAPFLTSTYSVVFTGGPGQKGKIANVNSLDIYQTIDGRLLEENDRVLVRHGAAADQGIYVVTPGAWVRAADFTVSTASAGARVFVSEGSQQNTLWTSFASGAWYGWNLTASNTVSNTNDWQEGNFWVARDDLVSVGADLAKVIQATRPIIEFSADLQLNVRVDTDGLPTDSGGTLFEQRKTEFNQTPLYDLYYYDGTHARKVTPIFFYVEDPTAEVDVALQRRVKHSTNNSADYVFNHGLLEEPNALLFYKDKAGALHTIWHPGYSQPTIVDQEFGGDGNGTLIATPGSDAFSAQQIWTLTALTPTTFEISGSKLKELPAPYNEITVGVPYSNGLFNATITAGSTPFNSGDTFKFRLGNFETTRYVSRDETESLFDMFGSAALDVNGVGAWQVPRMFFNNVAADNGDEVPEGTLYSHFRGVLTNQLESTPLNNAFGGSIKLWSEQQNLLASLLMQRDLTPISMIDMAERGYHTALNSLVDVYLTSVLQYFSTVEVLSSPVDTNELLDYLLTIRSRDQDVRAVLYDSTSPVVGFPATLPQLGVSPLVQPSVVFDDELGLELLQHHDGHSTALFSQTPEFRDRLFSAKDTILRSDGNSTSVIGSYTTVAPTLPYKGLIWQYPNGNTTQIRAFDVVSDKASAPPVNGLEVGDYWYNRAANLLSVWDGFFWQPEPNLLAPWVTLDMAELLNDLMLITEQRLYTGISTQHRTYFSESDVQTSLSGPLSAQMQRELATWAVTNGFDPTAPDYVSTDPFTWNYSSSLAGWFPALSSSAVPARWHRVLQDHHSTFGVQVVPTARPNIEPWKLLGNATKPSGWDALYRATVTPNDVLAGGYLTGATANAVSWSAAPLSTLLAGLPVVDGVLLTAGQIVLLTSEVAVSNNGAWVVSSGAWARASTPLIANTIFTITGGASFADTHFVLLANVSLPGDPVLIEQVRSWKPVMWSNIQAARPLLRLSVDVNRDALLPPYVNAGFPWAVNALSTVLPLNPAASYQFGEGSPVETVWTKSLEYRYSMARALFRKDPLAFLGNCWGFEWVEVDNILYDGYDLSVPGHSRFRLHGQANDTVLRALPITTTMVTGPAPYVLTIEHDGYTSARNQSFSVRDQAGMLVGYLNEGITSTLSGVGYTLSSIRIEDEGKPFRVGDKFIISGNADGSSMTVLFEPAAYHQILGFGQTFTHALRAVSIDTNQGYAMEAYRGWDVNLGYRSGGLVSTDDLRIFTDAEPLPESAFTLRFKRNPYAKDLWAQGLRVTVVQIGSSAQNQYGLLIPANDASDWTFRVEGYNTRYLALPYFDLNTSGDYQTFYALNQAHTAREWKQYTDVVNMIDSTLPLTVVGLQNVVTLLFGYSKKLEADGWVFDDPDAQNIDDETGRVRNWQLEIEKLVDRVYAGMDLGEGHVINPFIDRVWLDQPTGLLSPYLDASLFDVTAHPAAFDTLGVKIPTADLTVLRGRGRSQIGATVPMFSVHAQVDEYEHLFVLNNMASPSTNEGLIYDPFSGARIATLKVNGRRQGSASLRPEFGGHYLVGDEVKRNLRSSSDKISQYYDPDHTFEDELSTRHALALLGFSPKQYMSDLDLNDRTQFNFWRGLIQMKGTNASIDAFLNNDRFEDAKLDEYWAYKVAEYGDARPKVFPELKLTVVDTLQQFTKLIFDPPPQPADFSTFSVITSDDEERWFTLDDLDGETSFEAQVAGTHTETVALNQIITLSFVADKLVTGPGSVAFTLINGNTVSANAAGVLNIIGYGPSTPKFNPVKLFNYVDAELVEEIPHWHPAIGQHTPTALESVNVVSDQDPARYNVSTLVTGNTNFDPLRTWGAKEVGRVWWDTTNLEYLPYADTVIFGTVDERLSRWGTLADYASVDVAEWVESTVVPSEYETQAVLDAANPDLTARTRAEGTPYGAKTYSRERVWAVRPIAWSRAGVALESAHPSFNGAYLSNLSFDTNSGLAFIETGTYEQLGITAGMRLGAWQEDSTYTQALNEFLVLDSFTKRIERNGSLYNTFTHTFSGLTASVELSVSEHTDKVGALRFEPSVPAIVDIQLRDADGLPTDDFDVQTYLRIVEDGSGETEIIQIRNDRAADPVPYNAPLHGATFSTFVGQEFTYSIPAFGLLLTVKATVAGTFASDLMLGFIVDALGTSVQLFDAVTVEAITPSPFNPSAELPFPEELSNDPLDPVNTNNNGVGWRAWAVPTQAQLDADSRVPNSSWVPYPGPFSTFTSAPIAVVQDGANSAYTLNNGAIIERYQTSWTDWTELKQTTVRLVQTASGSQPVSVAVPVGTTADRVSVYINGVAQLAGTYTLIGTTVTALSVPFGQQVVVIVRAYSPTAEELTFDPSKEDDLLIQRQYKTDYQYVQIPVRDTDGSITSTTYYFWVKGRTTAAPKNNLSVKAVARLLVEGPSQYLTFQNINNTSGAWRYNALALAGLNYVVTKDDTFKLRFTRNFTLRDDPNQIDLKDTHVEWALIRPGQRTKIPEALWNKMVNTACAADAAGNTLPSPRRASYDARNGTRTRFGFGDDQVLAPTELVTSTLLFTILNTSLVDESGTVPIPDYMMFLDFDQSALWFSDSNMTRGTLTKIWNEGKPSQINELFFAVLQDILSANYEVSDIFKTSRLSAYSIKVVRSGPISPSYE